MIYLIKGNEQYFIENKIKELSNTEDSEVIIMDGSEKVFNMDELLDYCGSSSLFSQRNTVIIKDPCFLISKYDEKEAKKLINYVKEPLYETDLILYTLEDKFSSRLTLYKEISKNAQVITLNSLDEKNFPAYAMQEINKSKLNMTRSVASLLISMCSNSATALKQNLEILSLYPDTIDENTVNKLCTRKDDEKIYDLVNAYINLDASRCISLIRQLVNDTGGVLGTITMISMQLRFLYQIAYYMSKRKSDNEIASILKISSGRLFYAKQSLKKLNTNRIMDILNDLSELEIDIKTDNSISEIDKLEMFVLTNIKERTHGSN